MSKEELVATPGPKCFMGVDTGFGPDKTVAVLGSYDASREVPFVIHEVFEVARWEETDTHILGYAPDGKLVAEGNKELLRCKVTNLK